MWKLGIFTAVLCIMSAASQAQDLAKGEKVFKKCSACHSLGEGAKNKVGPQLNGIVGKAAGEIDGFKYSKAMQESGLVWDEPTLIEYLRKPKNLVKGTKMAFAGLKKDDDIMNVIALLNSYAADGSKQ